jgi:hypothetical protein
MVEFYVKGPGPFDGNRLARRCVDGGRKQQLLFRSNANSAACAKVIFFPFSVFDDSYGLKIWEESKDDLQQFLKCIQPVGAKKPSSRLTSVTWSLVTDCFPSPTRSKRPSSTKASYDI